MIEKVLKGSSKYYGWLAFLLFVCVVALGFYLWQLSFGLGITGLSRDVSWGFYIAQFTFLVGVAASGLMVVLPYYLHDYKAFGKITILGEFLAIGAVSMCGMFIFADMGRLDRMTNIFLHPTPNSIMFWDVVVLSGYLGLNVLIAFPMLWAEKKEKPPRAWVKPLVYISIAWAPLIHTVTAFLYAGLPGRHLWLTAIMAARFLASAFAGGPAILLILYMIMTRTSSFKTELDPVPKLTQIALYAMITNMFFLGLEFFTAYYSQIPAHIHSLEYLYFGLHGEGSLAPFMWTSMVVGIAAIILLLFPQARNNRTALVVGLTGIFLSTWIDKGLGLVVGGFIPNPLDKVVEYTPTFPELMISAGIFAAGALIITLLYKLVIGVREEVA